MNYAEYVVIGIDVSKSTLDWSEWNKNRAVSQSGQIKNCVDAFEAFHQFKERTAPYPLCYVLEHTSVYSLPLSKFLTQHRIPHVFVDAFKARKHAQSIGERSKTDEKDAYSIADYVVRNNLPYTQHSYCESTQSLKAMNTITEGLMRTRLQLKNLNDALKHSGVDVSEELEILDEAIAKAKEAEERVAKKKKEALKKAYPEADYVEKSIQGVGMGTLCVLLPHIMDSIDRFSLSSIVAYCGLDVASYQSGTSVYKKPKITKKGSVLVRKHLYMSALSASRFNPILKAYYQKKKAEGKPFKVIAMAIARKLIGAIIAHIKRYRRMQKEGLEEACAQGFPVPIMPFAKCAS
jgi:transposase